MPEKIKIINTKHKAKITSFFKYCKLSLACCDKKGLNVLISQFILMKATNSFDKTAQNSE